MSTFRGEPAARFGTSHRRLRAAASTVIERLEARRLLSVAPAYSGSLSGKVLFTSGGHGYVWRGGTSTWGIMRTYVNGMMEDLGNQDQLQPYADYALHAGATVVSMRPLGQQVQEVLVDNSDAGFSVISGSWSNSTAAPYWSNNNGNDTAHYRFANTALTETAVSRFTPNIPTGGFWPVYAWYGGGSNRARDATFRINYAGGSQEVKVAQDMIGGGWVYLGNYYFNSGTSGNVEVSNKSATTGKVVVADAIRFGNGMGDWTEFGAHPVSGQPRENECALYWAYDSRGWNGANNRVSTSVVYGGSSTDDETKNFSACDNFAAYMNNEGVGLMTDRLWISYHSNAGGGRGTEGLITSNPTPHQSWLANAAGSTVQTEMSALDSTHEFAWNLRATPTYTGGYGEISNGYINGEFDATIIEVAYHDNATDAALLKDPKVRWDVGRATMHTAIKYFDQWDPAFSNTTYLPEPPTNLRAATDAGGNVTLNWSAGPTSSGMAGPYGNAATGYRVWTSTNGYGFDLAATLGNVTTFTLPGSVGAVTYYRVSAINAGGESLASWVVAAKPQSGRRAAILIVNNFQRVDDDGDKIESHYFGTAARARIRYNNSFDYVAQAADSVMAYNTSLGVETATDDAVAAGQVVLGDYQSVIWLSGEQSTVDETFTATTEPLVTNYLNAGGKLFVSGSEIAWDLMGQASETAADRTFYQNTLHSKYVSNDSAKHATAAGISGTALAGVAAISFDDGTHGTYDVDMPDVIDVNVTGDNNLKLAMNYAAGAGGAVVQYSSGTTRVINMAFPFESIYTPSERNALMAAVLTFFDVNSTTTGSPQPSGVDLLAATDSGQSGTDNRTNFNNSTPGKALQFAVTGTVSGNTIKLYSDGILIGSAIAAGSTTNITTNGASALTNAAHVITATQTQPGRDESTPSPSLSVTIDAAAPATPAASNITTGTNSVGLDWPDVAASDLWGYNVFRGTTNGGPYTKISGATPISLSSYTDNTAVNGTTYYYVVSAVDTAGNESGQSPQATATPNPGVSRTPASPDLSGGFDTGPSSTDNITRRNNSSPTTRLQFFVNNTLANATVTIFADGVAIGSTVATSASATVLSDGTTTIADGTHNVTATLTEPGKPVSPLSAPLSLTIDSAPPTATVGTENPARGAGTFDFTVNYHDAANAVDPDWLDGGDITVTGPNGYNEPATFINLVGDVATYRVPAPGPGGSWDATDNGNYTVFQNATQVEDMAGNIRAAGTIGTIGITVPFAYMIGSTLNADFLTPGMSITLTPDTDALALTRGAETLSFPLSDFTALVLNGTGGADTIESSLTLAQPVTFNGGVGGDAVIVHAQTFTFDADAAGTTSNLKLTVDAGAAVSFQATQHLDTLTLDGAASLGPDGARVLVTRNLTLGPAGTLDLNDNDFVLDYSTTSPVGTWTGSAYDGVTGLVQSARNGGSWDGTRGITSTTAQTDGGLSSLGVAESSDILGIFGSQTAVFSGETVDSTSVLIKFTYSGDANLSGTINVDDYGKIDFNAPLGTTSWFNGDFNYDGKINVDDYGIIDFNVAIQGTPL